MSNLLCGNEDGIKVNVKVSGFRDKKKKKKKKNILAQNRECREGSGLQKQIEVSPSCPAGCTE